MRMSWYSICNLCQAPLDPKVHAIGKENKAFVRYYKNIRPLFTYNNEHFYSFLGNGTKAKHVCYSCFLHKPRPSLASLKSRELGQCRNVIPKSKSKTEKEIMHWYSGLIRAAYRSELKNNLSHARRV